MIERPDWEEPTEVPAPVPAKEQSIPRPDWTDGPPVDVPAPAPGKKQAIARPDWTEPDIPVEVSTSEARPDWPLVPDEPVVAEEAPVVDTPPRAETMIAALAETGEHDLEIAHEVVQATLEAVPIADRAGFVAGFDGLPPGVQKAIVGELALPGGEWEGMADEDELEKFATTPEGAELVQEWDDDADVNLARVQARILRIEANTSPGAIEVMWSWFDSLPSSQARTVLRALAQ